MANKVFISVTVFYVQQTHQVDNPEKCCFVLAFAYILITPHLPAWVNDSAHVCICVGWLYTLFSARVIVYSVPLLFEKEGETGMVNLAPLSFPQPFYMCNYIPPLIENRALSKSSCNKELLFPCCVYLHVCVAKTTSYPWVFPLILSSRLIPYRKLITDWLVSCFPLISHGPAWGSVLRDWWTRDQEQ